MSCVDLYSYLLLPHRNRHFCLIRRVLCSPLYLRFETRRKKVIFCRSFYSHILQALCWPYEKGQTCELSRCKSTLNGLYNEIVELCFHLQFSYKYQIHSLNYFDLFSNSWRYIYDFQSFTAGLMPCRPEKKHLT
jgi:hypothetical protein